MSWIHNQGTSSFEGYLITTKNQKLLTGWLSYGKNSFYTKDESRIFRWNEPITLYLHITNNSPNAISNIQAKIYKETTLLTTQNITSIAAGGDLWSLYRIHIYNK